MEEITSIYKPFDNKPEPIRIAKIDGNEVPYSACSDQRETYRWQEENSGWVYLGEGVIWIINGVNQNTDKKSHFWKAPTF